MPYVWQNRMGLRCISMPALTQTLGPSLPEWGKQHKNLSEQKRMLTELIDQLPPFDVFNQRWHYSMTNWLPFYWRGYQCESRCTYVLSDLTDQDKLWANCAGSLRHAARKAEKRVSVRTDLGVEAFLDLNEKTFKRQGKSLPYSRDLVRRIDAACQKHDSRRIFIAEDANGNRHAGAYIIWDDRAAYYLMSGSDPEFRDSAALSLVLWEAIKFASTVSKTFDFEGSMIEAVERFFRQFGAEQKTYSVIKGYSRRGRVVESLRGLAGRAAA